MHFKILEFKLGTIKTLKISLGLTFKLTHIYLFLKTSHKKNFGGNKSTLHSWKTHS